MRSIKDNVFIVLMPGSNIDLKALKLILDFRYREYMKVNGISVTTEQEEIFYLRPTFMGMKIDLKALWKKLFSSS